MSVEGGNSGRSSEDAVTEASLRAQGEGERRLYDGSPVGWLRGAVALDTQKGASEISDVELADRYSGGGFAEWDPRVANATRLMLRLRGFTL